MEDFILQAAERFGFPAIVCLYTLFCVNKSMKDLTSAINKLTDSHSKKLEHLEDDVKSLKFKLEAMKNERR